LQHQRGVESWMFLEAERTEGSATVYASQMDGHTWEVNQLKEGG